MIKQKWQQLMEEIFSTLESYDNQVRHMQNNDLILALRREENQVLSDMLARHKRELDYLAGELKPMAHEGSAIIRPVVSGSVNS